MSSDSVLHIQLATTVTTEQAKVEDPVEGKVTRDVRVGDTVAIPAGTRVLGSVTQVERGGKVKEKAKLAVRFHTLVLPDAAGTRVSIRTDAIYREGDDKAGQSTAKIGGAAVGGAILGAIIGGGKGAAIGAAVGGGAGTAVVMSTRGAEVRLPAGTALTVRLTQAVTVRIRQ